MRLDRIRQDEKIKINIQHGPTPTAPTIMTHSDGFAIGLEKKIKIESNALKLTFDREEFKENPMPWEPTFEGEKCHAPIYYEECNE